MSITKLQAILLAAGASTRFKTEKTKLIEKICGQEMVLYVIKLLEQMGIPMTVVVGFQKEKVKKVITDHSNKKINFVIQEQQQGTGHALLCTQPCWNQKHILIMNSDMPLVPQSIIQQLYDTHIQTNAVISFVTAHNSDPSAGAYGRVIKKNKCIKIIEAHEFDGDTYEHCCINAGIYLIQQKFLKENIEHLSLNRTSNEFNLPELIYIASKKQLPVNTVAAPFDQIRGVNNLKELWAVEQIKRAELIKYWMERGVQFSLAQNVHIDLNVTIGAGTHIGCGVHLVNKTKIGKNCKIYGFSSLSNATIANDVIIYPHCIINNAKIDKCAQIGPFAHVHSESIIEEGAIVGNFVELKKTTLGKGSKAKHLAYLGDATIGAHVNIGAGTITCNYDGVTKHPTIIHDNVEIGSNNSLVAPVTIEKNARTGAGSVITEDVPKNSLAIARSRQINKEKYVKKTKKRSASTHSFIAAIKTKNNITSSEKI